MKKENESACGSHECHCKKNDSESENLNQPQQNAEESKKTGANLQQQNEELKKQYNELKDTLQRTYAEFQNFKRRNEEERRRNIETATEDLLKRVLPVLDNMEIALMHKKGDDDFSKAIELIYAQFHQVIEDEGVKKILSDGKYNPNLHEIIMVEESPKEEGVILEEFQKGYTLGGKVLRHSKVKIAKKKK
jgi:molecular chaperone GrpE